MAQFPQLEQGFPAHRPRRLRRDDFTRRLVRENLLSVDDLIYPAFVLDGNGITQPVASMPGVERHSIDRLLGVAEQCAAARIPVMALFPVIEPALKTPDGRIATDPDGLVPRAVRAIKKHFPQLGVLTDVALDPFTSHGQDGVIDDNGYVINDITVELLRAQAVVQAEAGVDIVAPSDMMDGRIGAIRHALEDAGHIHTRIMAYSAKYASGFYGPFRDAVGSARKAGEAPISKATYQMNPANRREAAREAILDAEEGADLLMVKPAGAYLDIIRDLRESTNLPIAAFQVSGEYAQLHAAAEKGWLDLRATRDESLLAIRRAGADVILSYFAEAYARDFATRK